MSVRRSRRAVAAMVAMLLLMPLVARAQPQTQQVLPPGVWEGTFIFNGTEERSFVRVGGSVGTIDTEVTSSASSFSIVVDESGQILSGTLDVSIEYTAVAGGTAPVTFDPVDVVSNYTMGGLLDVRGTAAAISISGTVEWDIQTFASGSLIEEVSGVRLEEVEWVFAAAESDCATLSAPLVGSSGPTLVPNALGPQAVFDGDDETFHKLIAVLWGWPVGLDPDEIQGLITAVTVQTDEAIHGVPSVQEIFELIHAVEILRAELARLDVCQVFELPGGSFSASWLATLLRPLFHSVLDGGVYETPYELVAFLGLAVRSGAMDAELRERFGVALAQEIETALLGRDWVTLADLAVVAARYGYDKLYQDAKAALEEGE